MELVLATRNPDKVREIKEALKGLAIKIFTREDFPQLPPVQEKNKIKENALIKARTVARFTGKLALADDSGLEVEALAGSPGAFSSRFAGEKASYEDNNRKLLFLLKGVPLKKRGATFRCIIAISHPQGREELVEGICKGTIMKERMGEGGFGYDPLFQPRGFQKTFAQMSLEEKNRLSHRGRALKKARLILEEWARPVVIGLTGNMGSGKTTVTRIFKDLGAEVIEADEIGHLLLQTDEVKNKIIQAFGKSILDDKGEVDRKKLRRKVFKNEESLKQLNFLLHPLMAEEIKRRIQASSKEIIVLDAAVLLEAGWDKLVDKILVISTSRDLQLKRIRESTDFNQEEIKGVVKAQLPQEEKIKRADFLIKNKEDIGKLNHEIRKFWKIVKG